MLFVVPFTFNTHRKECSLARVRVSYSSLRSKISPDMPQICLETYTFINDAASIFKIVVRPRLFKVNASISMTSFR